MNSNLDKATIIRGIVKIDELAATGHIFHRYSEELYPIVTLGSTTLIKDKLGFEVPCLRGVRQGTPDLVGYFRKLAAVCGYRVIEVGELERNGAIVKTYRLN